MDSDSDATVIIDSDDDLMEVEPFVSTNSSASAAPLVAAVGEDAVSSTEEAFQSNSFGIGLPVFAGTSSRSWDDDDETTGLSVAESSDRLTNPNILIELTDDETQSQTKSEDCTSVEGEGSQESETPIPNCDIEDDGKTCPICFDNWTNQGEHRLCALKCGHLFGASCVMRWFSLQKQKFCPTCKKKASKSDLRYIYARKLIAMDASELEELRQQLIQVTEEKNKCQIELTNTICREHLILQQVEDLKKKVAALSSMLKPNSDYSRTSNTNEIGGNSNTVRLYMEKQFEICKEGGCRVFDYYKNNELISVSMKSPNSLFRGFGIRKIDIAMYRPTAFIPLHSMSIRDLCFHPQHPWLLSVSLDRTFKVVDTHSATNIVTYNNSDAGLWSCCWDVNDANSFFVGKQQGAVEKFDIRNMGQSICTLDVPGDMSPVVSVASVAASPGDTVAAGGIISCKLNSLWLFEGAGAIYKRCPLPIEGPFVSMVFQNKERQMLVSTRSNARVPYSRHHLCTFENGDSGNVLCNTVHCFTGSSTQKLLSRSCLLSNGINCYVSAYQEASKSVNLWSVSSGQKVCTLPAHNPVLDLCGVTTSRANFLVSLTDRRLEFFRFA